MQRPSNIILIETSTSLCSVALCTEEGEVLEYRETTEPRAHASQTAPLVSEVLESRGLKVSDCLAVAVSSGPGSYTGLRVGSSTAKGLCFGAGLPLVAVSTLDILAAQAVAEGLVPDGCKYIIPMVDARRMEVYSAVYDASTLERLSEIKSVIVDSDSYSEYLSQGPALFIGDGALKCREVIGEGDLMGQEVAGEGGLVAGEGGVFAGEGGRSSFVQCCPKASAMAVPACAALKAKRFEDVAYFEPFYLKDFIATVSKKSLF